MVLLIDRALALVLMFWVTAGACCCWLLVGCVPVCRVVADVLLLAAVGVLLLLLVAGCSVVVCLVGRVMFDCESRVVALVLKKRLSDGAFGSLEVACSSWTVCVVVCASCILWSSLFLGGSGIGSVRAVLCVLL